MLGQINAHILYKAGVATPASLSASAKFANGLPGAHVESQPHFDEEKAALIDKATPYPSKEERGVKREEAELDDYISTSTLKRQIGLEVKKIFGILNKWIFLLIAVAMAVDNILIVRGVILPDKRLITEKILLALVAGTVAQIGVAFIAIVRYLFPRDEKENNTDTK